MPLFYLLALTFQPASTEPVQSDVVVIGDRLKLWTGTYAIRGSRMKCATKRSSGDAEIDAIGCAAFQTCADGLQPRIAASDVRALDRRTRLAMKDAIKRDLSACVLARRDELIADLAERRFQARQR
jgi:hypothetical protein